MMRVKRLAMGQCVARTAGLGYAVAHGERDVSGEFDGGQLVSADGPAIRRRRRARGWSRRELSAAIAEAARRATGLSESVSPNLLAGVEERGESIPYTTLCLIAGGLDCNPVELLR